MPVLEALRQVVTDEDNIQLTTPFRIEEFKETMFSMQSDKCPGPDGFNPGFYQHFCEFATLIYLKIVCLG